MPFTSSIPEQWKDPKTNKIYDLTKVDLVKPAVFQSDYAAHKLFLRPTQSQYNEGTKKHERVLGSGVRVICVGGSLVIHNKRLLGLVMDSTAYRRGTLRIDYSDPSGFWRDVGMVKTTTVEVPVFDAVEGVLQYKDLANRFKDVKIELDENGEPIPVTKLHNLVDAKV